MEGTVSRKRKFDAEKLLELSQMLAENVPLNSIANHFQVDRTSIRYQIAKLQGSLSEELMEVRRQRALAFKKGIPFESKYTTVKNREGHCKRCEILLEYAKEGRNETHCGECLNELGIL